MFYTLFQGAIYLIRALFPLDTGRHCYHNSEHIATTHFRTTC